MIKYVLLLCLSFLSGFSLAAYMSKVVYDSAQQIDSAVIAVGAQDYE